MLSSESVRLMHSENGSLSVLQTEIIKCVVNNFSFRKEKSKIGIHTEKAIF